MKKTKELAKDSIFCAIVSTLIILFNAISMWDYMYISIIITIFIGCYFQNKSLTRMLMSGLVILGVAMLIINPLFVLIVIFPSITLGVISSLLFKIKIRFLYYFLIVFAACFGLNVLMELAFVKYIVGMDLVSYILADDVFGMNATLANFGNLLITVYMMAILIISLFETVILYNINHIYKRKIIPLLGEKI